MASTGKKKTTMAKLARESRLRERRVEKQAKRTRGSGPRHIRQASQAIPPPAASNSPAGCLSAFPLRVVLFARTARVRARSITTHSGMIPTGSPASAFGDQLALRRDPLALLSRADHGFPGPIPPRLVRVHTVSGPLTVIRLHAKRQSCSLGESLALWPNDPASRSTPAGALSRR
jgi:hypothetical protein